MSARLISLKSKGRDQVIVPSLWRQRRLYTILTRPYKPGTGQSGVSLQTLVRYPLRRVKMRADRTSLPPVLAPVDETRIKNSFFVKSVVLQECYLTVLSTEAQEWYGT